MKHIFNGFNHVTDRFVGFRSLLVVVVWAILVSIPFTDTFAVVNPKNFSVRFGTTPDTTASQVGTPYFCMPRYNEAGSGTYQRTNQNKILNNDGIAYHDNGPSRKAAITRKTVDGSFRYSFYTLFNTTSTNQVDTAGFQGTWFTRSSDHKVRFHELNGKAKHKDQWYFALANDEYGNLVFASATYDPNNKTAKYKKANYFPNHLSPIMVDGEEIDHVGAETTAASPLSPGKSVQVWGQDDDYCNRTYPDTYPSGSPDKKGACQIIQATGDFGTYNNADAIAANRNGKGGYVWFAPYAITVFA